MADGRLLVTEPEAAQLLGFTRRFLQERRRSGDGPLFVRIGRSIRYRPDDLREWVEQRVATSTSDVTAAERTANGSGMTRTLGPGR